MFVLTKEKPGVISETAVWVFIDSQGWLYIEESLLDLVRVVITEWRQDKHLCGYRPGLV